MTRVLDVLNSPWAIVPEKKLEIDAIYATHLRGEKIDIKGVEAMLGRPLNNAPTGYEVRNGVAVIPVHGVIGKRMNLFMQISGGVSTQLLAKAFHEAMEDPAVSAILLDVDSGGGTVDGTEELARAIFGARGTKPIAAVADGLMASAAYWIGSAADRVYAKDETTMVGSIGVVATHVDYSKRYESFGIKVTEITAGKYKRIASSYAPLSQEGRQSIQDECDYLYGIFLGSIAQHRGAATAEEVHERMGDGRLFFGKQALDAGLVDGVATTDRVIAMLTAGEIAPTATTTRAAVPASVAQSNPGAGDAPNAATPKEEPTMENKKITAEDAQPFVDAAVAKEREAHAAALAKAREEGATAERERIQAVRAQSMPGHEALIDKLAFDGKTTGPEAAVQVLAAEKEKKAKVASDLKADAPAAVPAANTTTGADGQPKKVKEYDPSVVAKRAQAHIAEQKKLGITVSAEEAAAHVIAQMTKEG